MAGQGTTSVGMGVTVGLLGVVSAGLFVSTLVLWSNYKNATSDLEKLTQASREIVKEGGERTQPETRALLNEAGKPPGRSLLKYLTDKHRDFAMSVAGNASMTPANLEEAIKRAVGDKGTNLLGELQSARAAAEFEKRRAADAEQGRLSAETKLTEVSARITNMEEDFSKTKAAMSAEMTAIKAQAEKYRTDTTAAMDALKNAETTIRTESNAVQNELNGRLSKSMEQVKILEAKNRELTAARGRDQLKPTAEFALIDGQVTGVEPGDSRLVYINRGQKQRMVLGMTFEVYSDPSELVMDSETGDYRSGKAAIEVVRLDPDQALCRVVRTRGRVSVNRGDVIANAIYDPNKVYSFLVIGNFDAQGLGSSTPEGAGDVKALISSWGGRVLDGIQGDLDFLVLGARPVVPPAPPPNAPIPVVQEYLRLDRAAKQYDEMFRQAAATSIPVLNQNRLFTLIGR